MSDWFWKQLSWFFGWVLIAGLFVLVIFSANIEMKDLDLWLHLASGRYILQEMHIPDADVFSATIAGKPWVNHEWLFQVIIFCVYQLGGLDGLIMFQVGIVAVTFLLLLFLGYNRDKQVFFLFSLLLVILTYQLRFTLRPDLFSLLFFVLYIFVLSLRLMAPVSIGILFCLQVAWSNIHGFFIVGPLLILLSFLAEWCKRKIQLPFDWNQTGRLSDEEYQRLKLIFLFVVAACFINPYFIEGVLYPFKVLFSVSGDSKIFFEHIGELRKPINFNQLFSWGGYPQIKALIYISFFSFVFNYRKLDIGIFLFWLMFLLLALNAVRNVVFFAFAAYFAILANAQNITAGQFVAAHLNHDKWKAMVAAGFKLMLILWIINYAAMKSLGGYFDFDRNERKSEFGGGSLRNFPYKAVDFLVQNGIQGKFFNDFNSGSYLIGRVYPDVKVFIDGRTEMYGSEFFEDYQKIWKGDKALFDEYAQRYQLTGAFLNSVYVPAPEKIIRHLYADPQWALVYFDYDAAIFLRDVPQNNVWINRFAIDLNQWKTEPVDLKKFGVQRITPYRYVNRGHALFNLGLYEKAKSEAQEALRVSPDHDEIYKLLGKIAIQEKQFDQGFELLRKAKMLSPADMEVRYYLAEALFYMDEMALALGQCEKVLSVNPKNSKGLFLLSRIYAKQKKYEQARQTLRLALEDAPEDVKEMMGQYNDEIETFWK